MKTKLRIDRIILVVLLLVALIACILFLTRKKALRAIARSTFALIFEF